MRRLVQNCPSVRSITIHNSGMSDAGLLSLSRTTGLQQLEIVIECDSSQEETTTEGILSLLRGGSRNVLRDLELSLAVSPDLEKIQAEADLIQQETGRAFLVWYQDEKFVFYMKVD